MSCKPGFLLEEGDELHQAPERILSNSGTGCENDSLSYQPLFVMFQNLEFKPFSQSFSHQSI